MKKIIINKELCLGCGSCAAADREHIDFDDSGFPKVISNENLDSNNLNNAICSCPTSAISIEEVEECNCQNDDECNCDDNCTCGENCNCSESCNCGCK